MQREIKFRAKGQTDGKWHYGLIVRLTDAICHIKDKYTTWICDAETVGQYTGLKDKNGKEIYEGDVCRGTRGGSKYIFTVKWDEEDARFLGFTNNGYICYVGQEPCVEVIGNIHNNPELLEVKHE